MRVPMLDYCCCGCTLQTGSVLIGTFELVRSILALLESLIHFHPFQFNYKLAWTYFVDGYTIATSVFAVLMIAASILLIVAANKNRHRLVFWWLIINSAITIILALSFPATMTLGFMYGSTPWMITYLVLGFLELGLEVYFMLVVYSYFRIIVERAPGDQGEFV
ncbi:uncharacterized protein LOC124794370 [Schistocerca piceifrons]|uniref:uncharacterized protein LOC124794370 n=1 Tax=Schistocerca piceifrons TaxID=274613 RepID=UPI001F5F4CD4|nr:uncharacterized protein LOC124794370 [Schistocerca piceifrons]